MNKNGLTLIEIMVVLTVLTILSLSLYTVFKTSTDASRQGDAVIDVSQNVRGVLEMMSREMAAAFISATDSVYSMYFVDNYNHSGTDRVDFTALIDGMPYEIGYYLDTNSNTLKRRKTEPDSADGVDGGGSFESMAFDISDLQFSYVTSAGGTFTSGDIIFDYTSNPVLPYAVKIALKATSEEETGGEAIIKDKLFETIVYISVK